MRRREFIRAAFGGAASAAVIARAQPAPFPTVGVLVVTSIESIPRRFSAFNQGLLESGYVAGRNVAIEYRSAEGRPSRLPELVTDLVRRRVNVIVTTGGSGPALAAKAATSTIPIVFTTGDDPVQVGLIASLSRPGGNLTGVTISSTPLVAKRMELLRELAPKANKIAMLIGGGPQTDPLSDEHIAYATNSVDVQFIVLRVTHDSDLEATFALAARQEPAGLLVAATPFLLGRRVQIAALAARYDMPAIYPFRDFCEAGGLMSYGPDVATEYRQVGIYTGRILNGTAPDDLPVQLPIKFELVINLKTATALGLAIPRLLNARVDEVIE